MTRRVARRDLGQVGPDRGRGATGRVAALVPLEQEETHYFAFKAFKRDMIRLGLNGQRRIIEKREVGGKTAKATVEAIVPRLRKECEKVGPVAEGDVGWVMERSLTGCASFFSSGF